MHFYRTGGDKPPLVLSHGFGDDGLCWTRLARALEPDYDVVMPDARGHGLSDAPVSGYAPSDRAADLAAFISALGLDRPAIGGHSMGASTSLYCAALHPDVVRALFLEDPGLRLPDAARSAAEREARAARSRDEMTTNRTRTREELMAVLRERHPTWDDAELEPWADSKIRVSPAAASVMNAEEPLPWQEAIRRVTCPVLLITADPERGAIVTPQAAGEAKRLLPSLQLVRLAAAGHNIRREAFEPFVEAVRTFLGHGLSGSTLP